MKQSLLIGIDGNEANVSQRVGVNQYAYELLRHLHQLDTPHRFVVFLKNRPLPDLPPAKGNFSYEVFGPAKAWVLTGLTLRLFRRPRPDVLFSPSHYLPLVSPVKSAFSIMDLAFEKFPDYFKPYDLQQLRRWTKLSVRQAKKIITISQSAKQDIVDLYHVPAEKIAVIYPGYDEQTFHSRIPLTKVAQVRAKYHLQGKYFIFVGTLQPRKNLIRLIKAFAKLGGGSKLVIVGKKGWLYDDIFQLVGKLNLATKVVFLGFAAGDDLPALLKAAVAYILPSLYEGFGIPVVEAQACGAVTIVSRVSSLPEAAHEAAIYIDNPQSVHQIAESLRRAMSLPRSQRDALITAGRENAKRFSWGSTAAALLDLLTSL